jgi:hypothetical protein
VKQASDIKTAHLNYGDPKYATGYYFVCTQDHLANGLFEIRITCKDSTVGHGKKWHLWVAGVNNQMDTSRAGCNQHDVETGQPGCCGRSVEGHCTDPNAGSPGGTCGVW